MTKGKIKSNYFHINCFDGMHPVDSSWLHLISSQPKDKWLLLELTFSLCVCVVILILFSTCLIPSRFSYCHSCLPEISCFLHETSFDLSDPIIPCRLFISSADFLGYFFIIENSLGGLNFQSYLWTVLH